jgi:hypothetical protein
MTAIEGFTSDVVSPCSPHCEWTTHIYIPVVQRPPTTPEHKNRTGNMPARRAIFKIVRMIYRCGRAVLLADCMRASRITQRHHVGLADFRAEDVRGRPQDPSA